MKGRKKGERERSIGERKKRRISRKEGKERKREEANLEVKLISTPSLHAPHSCLLHTPVILARLKEERERINERGRKNCWS